MGWGKVINKTVPEKAQMLDVVDKSFDYLKYSQIAKETHVMRTRSHQIGDIKSIKEIKNIKKNQVKILEFENCNQN